ncbi:hypothetical protein PanWU01x14_223640 [Parasponia andersonii]|uniref:Uncharacterized protein n=1 Tax=Parasponia andersonii TaxID=3476 RepID=A0A2P5BNM8_PARAD|nr:hypothetical protein PanWU01x14_223640 [Parasponia andersonii]
MFSIWSYLGKVSSSSTNIKNPSNTANLNKQRCTEFPVDLKLVRAWGNGVSLNNNLGLCFDTQIKP